MFCLIPWYLLINQSIHCTFYLHHSTTVPMAHSFLLSYSITCLAVLGYHEFDFIFCVKLALSCISDEITCIAQSNNRGHGNFLPLFFKTISPHTCIKVIVIDRQFHTWPLHVQIYMSVLARDRDFWAWLLLLLPSWYMASIVPVLVLCGTPQCHQCLWHYLAAVPEGKP